MKSRKCTAHFRHTRLYNVHLTIELLFLINCTRHNFLLKVSAFLSNVGDLRSYMNFLSKSTFIVIFVIESCWRLRFTFIIERKIFRFFYLYKAELIADFSFIELFPHNHWNVPKGNCDILTTTSRQHHTISYDATSTNQFFRLRDCSDTE